MSTAGTLTVHFHDGGVCKIPFPEEEAVKLMDPLATADIIDNHRLVISPYLFCRIGSIDYMTWEANRA